MKRFYIFVICTGLIAHNKAIFTTLKSIQFLKSSAVEQIFRVSAQTVFNVDLKKDKKDMN